MKQKTETAGTLTTHNKNSKLDSCDNGLEDDGGGDSPLIVIVDVEEAVASISPDILDPPSDLTRATAPAVSSVSEAQESLETAEGSVVSLCKKPKSYNCLTIPDPDLTRLGMWLQKSRRKAMFRAISSRTL